MIVVAVLLGLILVSILVIEDVFTKQLEKIQELLQDLNNKPTVVNMKVPEPKHEVAPVSAPSVVDHLPLADHYALNPKARRPE